MKNYLTIDLAPGGKFTGPGNTGLLADPGDGITPFAKFISSAVGLMTIIAIIWFVFTFLTGAMAYISAGSDKAAVEGARKKIVTGLIGLIIVIVSVFIINLIGFLIGIPNILDLGQLFNTLL